MHRADSSVDGESLLCSLSFTTLRFIVGALVYLARLVSRQFVPIFAPCIALKEGDHEDVMWDFGADFWEVDTLRADS